MAYVALISLKHTTHHLLNSCHLFIGSDLRPRLEFVCNELVPSIHEFLTKLSSFESNSTTSLRLISIMDIRMREAVCGLEDLIELHVSNRVLSSSQSEGGEISHPLTLSLEYDEIDEEVDYLTGVLHKIEEDYKQVNSIREEIGMSEYYIYARVSKESIASCKEILQDKTCELEDLSNQLLLEYESSRDDDLSTSTLEINDDDDDDDDDDYKTCSSSSLIDEDANHENLDFGEMVGLHDELSKLKHHLTEESTVVFDRVVSIVGMVGIGKTTLAKRVYEDPLIVDHFQCRVWVTVGPKYNKEQLYRSILAQTNPGFDPNHMQDDLEGLNDDSELPKRLKDDLKLPRYMRASLEDKRYLIVVDDVWNTEVCDFLFIRFPPEPRSRIMVTTRLEKVGNYACRCKWLRLGDLITEKPILKLRFLSKEESWHLFCDKIFGKRSCPFELEKVGKKIVHNCEGLPLAIITIGDHLSKAEKTLDYWNKVAEKKIHVFDSINRLLYSDYDYLPQNLKPCFLYIGSFPHDFEIPASKLINLWYTERFLEPDPTKTMEDTGMEYLEDLASRSVVLIRKHSSKGRVKACGIHYVFQHLCIIEAEKNKFFYVLNSLPCSSSTESVENQRRMCIHNNVLLGMKDVYDLMASLLPITVRSLLCTGPYHQYPVTLCFGLRLLRILDALTIRFYTFPDEVLKLFNLRYLAMTHNGELPADISKLWNLQYLIVKQHVSIKSKGGRLYLPVEIWNMKELRHIQVTGFDLPDPPRGGVLPNLVTLSDVSDHSCRKEVFEGIPNVRKLGVQIILGLDEDDKVDEHLCFFHHIAHLQGLESLKCIVVNPKHKSNYFVTRVPVWPSGLKKLSLSGFRFSRKGGMRKIGELTNLEVLKLRCCAFQGRNWKLNKDEFPKLKYMLIEDTDLKYWKSDYICLSELEHLIMRHCYKLRSIPVILGSTVIELVDCNPVCADELEEIGRHYCSVYTHDWY